jgi:hypothetical protein
LHGLFVGFRTINPSVVFFCHTFCNPTYFHSVVFSKPLFQSTHKSKKESGTPTATAVPEMRQKKNNSKLLYITCSYIRSPAFGDK